MNVLRYAREAGWERDPWMMQLAFEVQLDRDIAECGLLWRADFDGPKWPPR